VLTGPSQPAAVPTRSIVRLMLVTAASLAIVSVLHLSSLVSGGSGAGIPEAIICVVMLAGAGALARGGPNGLTAARASVVFAIAGFIIGLTFTLRGGDAFDVAYHVTGLALLLATLALLRGHRRPGPR
jgi:hypothetical protein